jgi:hypothetical protein
MIEKRVLYLAFTISFLMLFVIDLIWFKEGLVLIGGAAVLSGVKYFKEVR